MKICFLLGGFYQNGGIGRVTSVLANKLSEDKEYRIITLGYFNPKKPNIYELNPQIRQEYLMESYESMAKFMLRQGEKKLKGFLVSNDIDVLIACGALFFPIAVRACKKIKTKCICWEHSDPEGNDDHRGQNIARKYGIARSELNIVLTKRALKVYKEKYKTDNTIQIYNPIDPDVIKRAGEFPLRKKRIISVGRLAYQKNFEAAVEVAALILPSHPDWEWDIFGQGDELNKLKSLLQVNNLSKQMHFCGQVSDLYDRYKDYSIMVMTSRYEGFPMTLLEGMGNGLPLIAFDIPTGPDEIIVDGSNGYLIKAFNIHDMAAKIIHLMDNPDKREAMSYESRAGTMKFTEKEIIHKWKDALQKVVKK